MMRAFKLLRVRRDGHDGVEVAREVFEDAPESEDSPARENPKRRASRKK